MNRKQWVCAVAGFLLLVVVAFGQQQSGKATAQKDSLRTDLTDQLKQRIRTLETEQDELRARLAQVERTQKVPDDLREADLELARFTCETEFNKAHATALAHGYEGYTMEGAAARDCTQHLAKITEKTMRSLVENR